MASPREIAAELGAARAERRVIVTHEAWYADSAIRAETSSTGRELLVMLTALAEGGYDDGCLAEFVMTEHRHADRLVWSVRFFDDAWSLFGTELDLLVRLSILGENATEENLREALAAAGYVDVTPRATPLRPDIEAASETAEQRRLRELLASLPQNDPDRPGVARALALVEKVQR